jgi:hypothetical protein
MSDADVVGSSPTRIIFFLYTIKQMSFQNTYVLILLSILSITGVTLHRSFNYFPKTSNYIDSALFYGIIILFHSIFGTSGVTDKPIFLERMMAMTWFKFFTLMVVTYAAVRDIEDTIFMSVLFLSLVQLMRTKEERRRYPNIL